MTNQETRKEKLRKILADEALYPVADEIVFLEGELAELKKLPFLKTHPKDPTRQKATAAAAQYKGLLQQYTNLIKIAMKCAGLDVDTETSPLREWFEAQAHE